MKHFCTPFTLFLCLGILAGCASTQPYQTDKSVTSIAYSPSRTLLAYANANGIQVMEVASKRHIGTLSDLPDDPGAADPHAFRHGVGDSMVFLDDNRIASTGMGGLVSVWDINSGRRLAKIEPLPDGEFASTIDFSQATNRLAIGTSAGQVLLTAFDAGNHAQPLVQVTKLESYVWDLQFSRDGRYLASASLLLDRQTYIEPGDEAADAFARGSVEEPPQAASDDDENEMTGSETGLANVAIWDVEQKENLGVLQDARGVFRMSLVPGERALLTAGEDVQVWEFLTREQLEDVRDPSMAMQAIGMGAMAFVSMAALGAGVITPANFMGNTFMAGGFPIVPSGLFIRHACARSAAISPDGNTIVSTTWGPTLNVMAVIDRKRNKVVEKWAADGAVCDLQFSPDGKHLLAATSRGVMVFDTTNWKKQKLKQL